MLILLCKTINLKIENKKKAKFFGITLNLAFILISGVINNYEYLKTINFITT